MPANENEIREYFLMLICFNDLMSYYIAWWLSSCAPSGSGPRNLIGRVVPRFQAVAERNDGGLSPANCACIPGSPPIDNKCQESEQKNIGDGWPWINVEREESDSEMSTARHLLMTLNFRFV